MKMVQLINISPKANLAKTNTRLRKQKPYPRKSGEYHSGILRNESKSSTSSGGIIHIRYKGRSLLVPLSLHTQAPLNIHLVIYTIFSDTSQTDVTFGA